MNTIVDIPEAFPTGAAPDHLIRLALQKFEADDLSQLGSRINCAIADMAFDFGYPEGVRSIKSNSRERFDADAYVGHICLDKADRYNPETDAATLLALTAHLKAKMPFAKITFNRGYGMIGIVIAYCNLEKLFENASVRTERIELESNEIAGRAHSAMSVAAE